MSRTILFLDQQAWPGGGQRVLEATVECVSPEYRCIVALPGAGSFRTSLAEKNVEIIDIPLGRYPPGQKSLLEMASFGWRSLYCGLKVALLIRRRQVALVYINGPRCLVAGTLAAWITGRPAVFHLHLILTRKPEAILARMLARRISKIFACSHAAATSLIGKSRKLAQTIEVVYNPLPRHVEPMRRDRARTIGQYTIGIVGRITECKGHHLLLDAVAALSPELRRTVRILVVGAEAPGCELDARYGRHLREQASRCGLNGQMTWAGYQSDPGPCYELMDVLVQPSLAEAMCLAILEALDRGIPVIAARTGGIPEVVRDGFNGLLVSLEDRSALPAALTAFLSERHVREHLQAGARQRLDRRFSMETFSSRIRSTIGEFCEPENARTPEMPWEGHTE